MSLHAINWAFHQTIGEPLAKLVLIALAEYANPDTGACYPSIASIAKKTECSESTVHRKIAYLVAKKLIIKDTAYTARKQSSNHYELLYDGWTPPKKQPTGVSHGHPRGVTQTPGGVSHRHPNLNLEPLNRTYRPQPEARRPRRA